MKSTNALHNTDRGQTSDDEEEEGEVEEESESVKKGSDEEDSDEDAEQKEKKVDVIRQISFQSLQHRLALLIVSCNDGVCQVDDLSAAERESLLRNELRPAIKPFKGNKLFLRFATQGFSFCCCFIL